MYFLHHHHHHHLLLIIISLLFFFSFQHPRCCQAQDPWDPILVDCPSSNYPSGSRFEPNLKNRLLPALLSNGPRTGYFKFTAPRNKMADTTVYGLVQCRGDISGEKCRTCLKAASEDVIRRCPNKLDATIRYEKCLLRYSDVSFFSQADSRMLVPPMYSNQTVSDPAAFNRTLGDLLYELVSDDANSIPPSKFQSRYKRYQVSGTQEFGDIYGMAQCTQDISATDCFSCLRAMVKYIPTNPSMYGKRGGRVISKSCILRYEDYLFLDQLLSTPSP